MKDGLEFIGLILEMVLAVIVGIILLAIVVFITLALIAFAISIPLGAGILIGKAILIIV